MNRHEFEHTIRAAGAILGVNVSSFFQTGLFPSKINGHSYSFG